MLDAWTALFRPARPAHPGLTDLLHNRGNRLGLVTHGWRNVDAHSARFGGLHPEEIEQALVTAPVLLEEAAVALHAHALRRLPVMPASDDAPLVRSARTYGHPLSLLLLAARGRTDDPEGWRERQRDALLALVVAQIIAEAAPGNILSAQTRHEGLALLARLQREAAALRLDPAAETRRLSDEVVTHAAHFRVMYGLVPKS